MPADWTWLPARLRSERALLAVVLAAALALRLSAAVAGQVITHDGSRFLKMARLIDRAEWGRALEIQPHMPPMYPLLVRLGSLATGNFAAAAAGVAAVFGALAVLPLFFLAKSVANAKVAAVAGLIYAFLPAVAILHGETMSEGLFLFFFLSWMALLWSAEREPHWTRFALLGAAAGAAFLTRVEGIYCVAGTVGWLALRARKNAPILAAGAAGALLVFLVVAWPYLLWVRATTGKWKFTVNPFAEGILERVKSGQFQPKAPEPDSEFKEERAREKYGVLGGALFMVLRESLKVCFYVFLPLALLGIALARRSGMSGWGTTYLLLMMGGYLAPNVVAQITDQPFGYRYVMPSWVFATPFMAVAVLAIFRWLRRVRWIPAVASAALLVVMTVKIVRPRSGDRLPLKQAGLWIREARGPDRTIAAMDRRVEYYAQGDYVAVPQDPDALEAEFVVVYDRQLKHYPPDFESRLSARYREAKRLEQIRIYERLPSQR